MPYELIKVFSFFPILSLLYVAGRASLIEMEREYLENYLLLDKTIKRCEKKLKYYLDHPVKTVSGTVMSSMREFPYCLTHLTISASDNPKVEERRNELIKQLMLEIVSNLKKYEEQRIYVDLFLEEIDDLEIKEILNLKYIDGMTHEQIGEVMGYDQSSISKKIDAYFHKIHEG